MPADKVFFQRYSNRVFIETGTYHGEGVELALACGFAEVRSVELSEALYQENRRRFAHRPEVKLYCGASDQRLWEMIRDLGEPATFWLDAHYSGDDTVKGSENSPILKELAIIARHPIKGHIILIDDRRDFGTVHFDYVTEEQIRKALLAINPTYRIGLDTGTDRHPLFKDDVLVAQ